MYRCRSGACQWGGRLARTSAAAAETSAGHLHRLTEVMRVSGPEWTHTLLSERGFLLPGGLHSGLVVHGAAMVLISFANKLKLFCFWFFSVSAWWRTLRLYFKCILNENRPPHCVLKLGSFLKKCCPLLSWQSAVWAVVSEQPVKPFWTRFAVTELMAPSCLCVPAAARWAQCCDCEQLCLKKMSIECFCSDNFWSLF